MPWPLKRWLLVKFFKYNIHPSARIGLAWVYPAHLEMAEKSIIHHFTVIIHLDLVRIGYDSSIGRSNWVTGMSTKTESDYFKGQTDRKAELIMGKYSHFTKGHHVDCTNSIIVGDFVTIAGYQSQFLTHSINIYKNIQDSAPIYIGDYTFVGTNVVVLGGSKLPAYSVLGAKSLLNKAYTEEWKLYAGVPAKPVSDISKDAKYFYRKDGFVY
jgi:acetyltransferase-like isoleucine patch superfamily enzyme